MRYQRIYTQIWRDHKFRALSRDGKELFFYCLTSPHSNILGVFINPDLYVREDLEWGQKRLSRTRNEDFFKQMVAWDSENQLICVRQNLRHNPLINPNQVKSAIRILKTLPKSHIYQYLNIESLTESFHKPLVESLGESFGKPYPLPNHTNTIPLTEDGQNVDNSVDNSEPTFINKTKNDMEGKKTMPSSFEDIKIKEPDENPY